MLFGFICCVICAGSRLVLVGRIVSCVFCVFFCFFLKYLGDLGMYLLLKSLLVVVCKFLIVCGVMYVLFVCMYVIKFLFVFAFLYSCCVVDIVFDVLKLSCLFVFCCIVDVVNGGLFVCLVLLCFIFIICSVLYFRTRLAYVSVSSFEAMVNFLSLVLLMCVKVVLNVELFFEFKFVFIV